MLFPQEKDEGLTSAGATVSNRIQRMVLEDLTVYAKEKYQITEQQNWKAFPGVSVLSDPHTGKWAALLMRQWDEDAGEEIEFCDIKCGAGILTEIHADYITKPFRMKGINWAGVRFDSRTEPDVVRRLFDRAMQAARQPGYIVVLDGKPAVSSSVYQDTPLPLAGVAPEKKREPIPERIRKMRQLYLQYYSNDERKKFWLQGMYMRDYQDDQAWDGLMDLYYPTYQALTTKQLRGYFTWRTAVRRGVYRCVNSIFVNIYLSELLNQIGTASPRESLQKMREFEERYVNAGYGDEWLRKKLRRWMMEFAVIYGMHPEEARQYADPDMLARDGAMAVLRSPENHTDDEVYSALLSFAKEKLMLSSVILKSQNEGKALFAKAWKHGCVQQNQSGKNLFTQCFGSMSPLPWRPLANAMYWERRSLNGVNYQLNACRRYQCTDGEWKVYSYETLYFDRERFLGFIHETDRQLRIYLKTGHPLKEKAAEAWAKPIAAAVIEEDRKQKQEAARPKIVLNLSGLEQIRRDALATRDSLLTDEEKQEMAEGEKAAAHAPEPAKATVPAIPLDDIQLLILRTLLAGRPADGIIREYHLLPSVTADAINEAFFEEIGDSVVEENGSGITFIEDYIEDIRRLVGGSP